MKTEYKKIKDSVYKYQRSVRGLIMKMYHNQRQRCRDKKRIYRKMPEYNFDQLYKWLTKKPKFLRLYEEWVMSGYKKELIPSIDKINPLGNYCFNNIQIMTWAENNEKGRRERNITQGKRVAQVSLGEKEVKRFISITDAGKQTGVDFRQISNVLCGRAKTAGGYKWKVIRT